MKRRSIQPTTVSERGTVPLAISSHARKGPPMSHVSRYLLAGSLVLLLTGCATTGRDDASACLDVVAGGLRPIATDRAERFLGKVHEATARCRGGDRAVAWRATPWTDWQNYWATADTASLVPGWSVRGGHLGPNGRGIDGALLDLEYQRIELIKFNLFDNSGSYQDYVSGRAGVDGRALKVWSEMRLPSGHPDYASVGGDGEQRCQGDLIRFRTLTGICNDIKNPRMGSSGTPFARNVEFAATFPELGRDELARNRHGERLSLLAPDPQVISRKLFTRAQAGPDTCHDGRGLPGSSPDARCDYKKAPFFNVLAAFWIQFMTHDWFSHLREGANAPEMMPVGCPPAVAGQLGCRPDDRIDRASVAEDGPPPTFTAGGRTHLARAYKTSSNNVTAWWDASQLYGHDDTSRRRVKRAPDDRARFLMVPAGQRAGAGERLGYLPVLDASDPMNPQWAGQEAAAFPDNWSIGMSFYHTVFAREHNRFVEAFRAQAAATPDADSGLRNPARPRERHPLPRRHGGRALRGGAPRRLGGDRQDPHDGVDAAAALRRAPLPRHERQLARPRPGQGPGEGGSGEDHRPELRHVHRRQEGRPVVLGLRLRGRDLRPRQPGLRGGRRLRRPTTRRRPTAGPSRTSTTSTAASTTSARHSTSPRSSSPCTGCIRWCPTSSSCAAGTTTPT